MISQQKSMHWHDQGWDGFVTDLTRQDINQLKPHNDNRGSQKKFQNIKQTVSLLALLIATVALLGAMLIR